MFSDDVSLWTMKIEEMQAMHYCQYTTQLYEIEKESLFSAIN